jgi:hypothetical protein
MENLSQSPQRLSAIKNGKIKLKDVGGRDLARQVRKARSGAQHSYREFTLSNEHVQNVQVREHRTGNRALALGLAYELVRKEFEKFERECDRSESAGALLVESSYKRLYHGMQAINYTPGNGEFAVEFECFENSAKTATSDGDINLYENALSRLLDFISEMICYPHDSDAADEGSIPQFKGGVSVEDRSPMKVSVRDESSSQKTGDFIFQKREPSLSLMCEYPFEEEVAGHKVDRSRGGKEEIRPGSSGNGSLLLEMEALLDEPWSDLPAPTNTAGHDSAEIISTPSAGAGKSVSGASRDEIANPLHTKGPLTPFDGSSEGKGVMQIVGGNFSKIDKFSEKAATKNKVLSKKTVEHLMEYGAQKKFPNAPLDEDKEKSVGPDISGQTSKNRRTPKSGGTLQGVKKKLARRAKRSPHTKEKTGSVDEKSKFKEIEGQTDVFHGVNRFANGL